MNKQAEQPGLFIGIDWADRKHDCYVIDRGGKGFHQQFSHSPEHIDAWIGQMLKLADRDHAEAVSSTTCLCAHVQKERAAIKYLPQTFHEFADRARRWCPWSKGRYRMLRGRGMKHNAAPRKIAHSWIRILFRVWQTCVSSYRDRYIATR